MGGGEPRGTRSRERRRRERLATARLEFFPRCTCGMHFLSPLSSLCLSAYLSLSPPQKSPTHLRPLPSISSPSSHLYPTHDLFRVELEYEPVGLTVFTRFSRANCGLEGDSLPCCHRESPKKREDRPFLETLSDRAVFPHGRLTAVVDGGPGSLLFDPQCH